MLSTVTIVDKLDTIIFERISDYILKILKIVFKIGKMLV